MEEEKAPSRHRSRTMLAAVKAKLRRNRSSSDVDNGLPPTMSKCATLPARMGSGKETGKPKTLYWMGEIVDALDSVDKLTVTRNISEESVDSGFEQPQKTTEGSECDSPPSTSKALELLPQVEPNVYQAPRQTTTQASSTSAAAQAGGGQADSDHEVGEQASVGNMYDSVAVERAFGPMKDVGRWFKTMCEMRQRVPSVGSDETTPPEGGEEWLATRPLPPIPLDSVRLHNAVTTVRSGLDEVIYENEAQDVYEHVEHRMLGTNGLILGLRNLARNGWYWGPITRTEAEEKLTGTDDGVFLVRDSSDDRYLLSLSFRSQGKTLHTRIEYSNGYFSFYSFPDSDTEGYQSVVALIEHSMDRSRSGIFCYSRAKALGSPPVPVRLLKPLSRYSQVRSLQHYCRFVIRQSIRFDRIRNLPLPRHVKDFLKLSKY